jgi:DNA repair protein RecN (Recombination protein N)
LLLGALRLLLGAQGRRDLVGPHGDHAVVQGRFSIDGEEVVAVRRLTAAGKSRAYLDGIMAPVGALGLRLGGSVELTAQHGHVLLGRPEHVRDIVDAFTGDEGASARGAYAEAWEASRLLDRRRQAIGGDRRAVERELATVRHHVDDIAGAGFAPGDDVALEGLAGRLRNARAILDDLDQAAAGLGEDGAERHLDTAVRALARAAALDPGLVAVAEQATQVADLMGELRGDVARAATGLDDDPGRLDEVEHRVARLGELRRRYGDTLDDVLAFAAAAAARAEELKGLLATADDLDNAIASAAATLASAGDHLREVRRGGAERIAAAAVSHLAELGFADPVVAITVSEASPGPVGADRVELRFSSDVSIDPGPVARVASGGELSRLVLALRLASRSEEAPITVFDEIDAGVGGKVALQLGRKLAGFAAGRQVLCVTHLPQVAAHADEHYVVERSGAVTEVHLLDRAGRVEELARMLAGMPDSERGRGHAAELLATARPS